MPAASRTSTTPVVVLDDTYDDSCEVGKFVLNPCVYLFERFVVAEKTSAPRLPADQYHAKSSKRWQYVTYCLLLVLGWIIVCTVVFPLIRASSSLSDHHETASWTLFILCIASRLLMASPGCVTDTNRHLYDSYAYDDVLYHKVNHTYNNNCGTQQQPKLVPRSKLDRYTLQCIPRFDHYCGWLDCAVGEENYRGFILFLWIHTVSFGYGSALLSRLLHDLSDIPWQVPLLTVVIGITAVVLTPFFVFHLYLIATNQTTVEYYKWKKIRQFHGQAQDQYQLQQNQQQFGRVEAGGGLGLSDPGPTPGNFYDLGLLGNIYEVAFPRSLRKDLTREARKEV